MRAEELWNAIGQVDDALILAAAHIPQRHRRRLPARALLLAAVLALLAATAIGGYVKWHLAQPQTYTGDTIKPQSEAQYTYDEVTDHYHTPAGEPAATDEAFLQQAAAIITQVGGTAIDTTQMQLVHEHHERWGRDQVRITFPLDDREGEVVFDAATGFLISVTRFPEPAGEVAAPLTEAEALAAAQGWYEALPYCQGYVYTYVNPISDDAWMYSFTRQLEVMIDGQTVTLSNPLEEVRIAIDPRTGEFQTSNAFYVPLLDDHEAGDVPISREQALATALDTTGISDDGTWTITADYAVVLPNWWWTDYMVVGDTRAANVTRLAWAVTLERPVGTLVDGVPLEIGDLMEVHIDLYTGEVLGGGMV